MPRTKLSQLLVKRGPPSGPSANARYPFLVVGGFTQLQQWPRSTSVSAESFLERFAQGYELPFLIGPLFAF